MVPLGVRSGEVGVFFRCFIFGFVVIGANRRFPRLWPVGMADVFFFVVLFLVLLLLVQTEGFSGSGLWEWRMLVGI